MRAKKSRIFLIVVERPSRLPCRYSYWHSSKNVGKDADVATGVPSGSARSAGARLQGPAPGAMERDGPRRGGDQHDQADGNREGARGDAEIDGDAGQITAGGHNQHADAEIGAEDAAAEAVFGVDLEERAGEDPVGGAPACAATTAQMAMASEVEVPRQRYPAAAITKPARMPVRRREWLSPAQRAPIRGPRREPAPRAPINMLMPRRAARLWSRPASFTGKTRSPRMGSSTLLAPSRPSPPLPKTVPKRRTRSARRQQC